MRVYKILAIDTSCDETSAAVTVGRRVFSNVISSQVELHKKYGGVVPIVAQRAHREKIDAVIEEALKRANSIIYDVMNHITTNIPVDAIAVTRGPGLAPALEVGIKKAKELAKEYDKPLIAVNHMEGHLLSPFALNSRGKDGITTNHSGFPLMGLLVSGGHTQLVLMREFGDYKLLGETLDDACGEAFDKVAKMLDLGYPGGPIVEMIAKEGDEHAYNLPVPMLERKDLNFSFSGLKTAVLYKIRAIKKAQGGLNRKITQDIAAVFQRIATEHLVNKLTQTVDEYKPKGILLGGGVISNLYVRKKIRSAMKKYKPSVYLPYNKKLFTDNAAMIGVAAFYKALRGEFVKNIDALDRKPSLTF